MKNIDVSFITINYNSSRYTIELIKSIEQFSTLKYEIIIVDNASKSEDYNRLEEFSKACDNIKIIKNRINSGFASGNMLGVNYASGNYYFFINNDTKLLNDTSMIMKKYLENYDDIALATAKVTDENNNFSSSYKLFPSLIKELFGNSVARKLNKNIFPSNKITLDIPTEVEVISGSCMFFRADVFCEVGGFDTNFFLYCEEEDISKRVWNSGKKVVFLPEAVIYHTSGGSTVKSYEIEREYYISYKHLIFKHFNLFQASILMFLQLFKLFRRSFKRKNGFKLFLFGLGGFQKKKSLKYKQIIIRKFPDAI
ncbi:MAG: glycosyltransferase family 2 protein [Sulfurimonadaceae bacterium]|jgi:GT2 family glycosyltransferase|nr:glycosyltransferase family 2 protein [Sulfurimonadaceae bacterium]